jgi:hypothetical protein
MAAGLADHVGSLASYRTLERQDRKGRDTIGFIFDWIRAEGKEFRARLGPSDLTESTEIFPGWFEGSN